ncbi:hypothetical protein GOODEAATRI_004087 [Goodea atripinnis]|uniref:RNA 3'-terminal phosphate cyclase insert domain-containing protein n=1 Tax=Goodea atripinnis TaxID=208336 RepID=A0ABV0MP56_9TELE
METCLSIVQKVHFPSQPVQKRYLLHLVFRLCFTLLSCRTPLPLLTSHPAQTHVDVYLRQQPTTITWQATDSYFEASFIRLLDKVTNGSRIEINQTGGEEGDGAWSPGFGLTLVAETLNGCFLSAEMSSTPQGQGDTVLPEDLGRNCAKLLLEEVKIYSLVSQTVFSSKAVLLFSHGCRLRLS